MANVDRSKEFVEFPAAEKARKNQERSLGEEWRRALYTVYQQSRAPD